MALTDPKAKQAKAKEKAYKLSDEKGLYLHVQTNGRKYWRMKYRFGGREKVFSIGVYPEVSLKEARLKRDDARKLLSENIDPTIDKKNKKKELVEDSTYSFTNVAKDWYEITKSKWSDTHSLRVNKILERELCPEFGHKHIAKVTAPDLLAAIRKVEAREAFETAKKSRRVAGQVFRYGIASGLCDYDIAANISDAMTHTKTKHMASITDPKEVGKLMAAIDLFNGTATVHSALKLSPILFQRPGEIRHMEWAEINWQEERWEIPAQKMKMRTEHIVPLPSQALAILKEIKPLTGQGRYVFPNPRGASRPMSENAVRVALRSLGYTNEQITPHGFRAMARTLLDEELEYRIDWIEHQLAHSVKDATGRAYNRTKHLKGRKEMMQHWANYLETIKKNNIN
ncbi:integrase [Oleiphilus sp. HI0118]|nr:integrase [Oleiphilus sp. HI0118]